MDNIEAKIDAFWTSLEQDAANQANLLGFKDDMGCWDEVLSSLMRRTIAVRRMAKVQPLSSEWNVLSQRIADAESIIYSHADVR